jgi:hypothetical protein
VKALRRNIAYLLIIHLWGVSNKNSTEILPFLKFPIIFFLIITASDQHFVREESVPSFSGGNAAFSGGNGAFSGGNGAFSGGNGAFSGGNGAFSGGNGAFPPENAAFPPENRRCFFYFFGIPSMKVFVYNVPLPNMRDFSDSWDIRDN